MAEVSYIDLACQVLGVDPSSLLKSREEEEGVVIINQVGQKFRFSFEYLEDFKQYLEANSGDPERSSRDEDNAKRPDEGKSKIPSGFRGTKPQPRTTQKRTTAKKTPAKRKPSTTRKSKTLTDSQEGKPSK